MRDPLTSKNARNYIRGMAKNAEQNGFTSYTLNIDFKCMVCCACIAAFMFFGFTFYTK